MKLFKTTILLLFFAGIALAVSAQQKGPFNTEQAIQKKTDMMAQELGLDASQKAQLLTLNKGQQDEHKTRMAEVKAATKKTDNGNDKNAAKKAQMEAEKDLKAYDQAVRKMLKSDQVKKWDEKYNINKTAKRQ